MPRAKRVLAEADPNASRASRSKEQNNKRKAATQDDVIREPESGAKKLRSRRFAEKTEPSTTKSKNKEVRKSRKKESQHSTKDNPKLLFLLEERGLSTDGTREDWIERLDNSSVDYESYTTDELTEMLRSRNMSGASQYPKSVKIERLRLNDSYHRDTRNGPDMFVWVDLEVAEMMLKELAKEVKTADTYATTAKKRLQALLEQRKLSTSGDRSVAILRLVKHDQKVREKRIKDLRKRVAELQPKLEVMLGHPMTVEEINKAYNKYNALDNQIINKFQSRKEPTTHVCAYDWKDSHWASRTERELIEICARRGLKGYGPKAAMIKFLDTGVVEYEDLYASGLETICYNRGIKLKSNAKKEDMVRLLKEADEAEGV